MNTATAFVDEILGQARRLPHAVALMETTGRHLTYEELVRRVDGGASALHREGFKAGDAVLFTVRPSIASISLILAVVRAGGIVVAADPRMGAGVFESRVALARPRWVMADSLVYLLGAGQPVRRLLGRRLPELVALARVPARHVRVGPRLPGVPESLSARTLWRATPNPNPKPTVHPDPGEPIAIVFTSGTTARPKAVVHSNASLGAALRLMQEHLVLDRRDVVFTSELHLALPALHAGSTTVIPRRGVRARFLAAEIERHQASVAFAVPYELEGLIEWSARTRGRLPSRLRMLLLGSAPAYSSFMRQLRPAVAATTEVWSVYAMTEMLPACRVSMAEKLETTGDGDLVGMPFPGVGVRISHDGEVMLAGPNLFSGYLEEPAVTEHATGDLGRLDGDRLFLLGRRKDMLIRHGVNIYPALVEDSVMAVPGVVRCRLVGVPGGVAGDERVVLAVEAGVGVDAIGLARSVRRSLTTGRYRIDGTGLPDDIVIRRLPVDPRSRKVDTVALKRELQR